MTPAALRTALAGLLSDQLGTYTLPNDATVDAIYVGEPPSDWTASGLEVVIAIDPDFANTPLQNGEHNLAETNLVRLVQHGSGSLAAAVRRVARRFPNCSVRDVPSNERLGILNQSVITIPR